MANVLMPNERAVFLHLPKTAGHSVSAALAEQIPDARPLPTRGLSRRRGAAWEFDRQAGPTVVGRFWSFCFIRNPWDWAVSGWVHVTRNKPAYGDAPPDFAAFLTGAWDRGLVRNPHRLKFKGPRQYVEYHTQITQTEHLRRGRLRGPAPIAFYGRFERLAQDWERICDRLGREVALPHNNRSERTHYTEYYDDRLRDVVARRDAALIERFGYRFGG